MKSGCSSPSVRSSCESFASAGAMTASPWSAEAAATLAYQCVSRASSRTVTTSGISTPAEMSVLRRSEEHTSELQSLAYLVCRLLLEKKKNKKTNKNNKIKIVRSEKKINLIRSMRHF